MIDARMVLDSERRKKDVSEIVSIVNGTYVFDETPYLDYADELRMKNYEGARSKLEVLTKEFPHDQEYLKDLGMVCYELEDRNQALEYLDKATEMIEKKKDIKKDFAEAYFVKGKIYEFFFDERNARLNFLKAIRMDERYAERVDERDLKSRTGFYEMKLIDDWIEDKSIVG